MEQILEKHGKDVIRKLRAVEALEQIGTPDARNILSMLAGRVRAWGCSDCGARAPRQTLRRRHALRCTFRCTSGVPHKKPPARYSGKFRGLAGGLFLRR